MRLLRLLLPLAFLLLAAERPVAAERIEIGPATSEVGFRAYALGLLPLDGRFTRFQGWLTFDRTDHSDCKVELRIDPASLAMEQESVRDDVLGPDFMDAAQFPVMTYRGTCQTTNLEGMLTMHGVTRPFDLSVDWDGRRAAASGRLRRKDWGISGKPFLAGPNVRIDVSVPLPGAGTTR